MGRGSAPAFNNPSSTRRCHCFSLGESVQKASSRKTLSLNEEYSNHRGRARWGGRDYQVPQGRRRCFRHGDRLCPTGEDLRQVLQQHARGPLQPGTVHGARKAKIMGKPDYAHVSTSICERNNLNMRMNMRRFTRLTNAFSKKVENLEHSVALHFMHYNFCRIHGSLRVTPAMEAGVADHVWSLEEVIALLD